MDTTMQQWNIAVGNDIHTVKAVVTICGKDINICCGGGDTFHIGACTLAVPRPSLTNSDIISSSASVICVTGHKEDEIARQGVLRLAAKFNTRVSMTCGLHIDNATDKDIEMLYNNYLTLLDELELYLSDYWNSGNRD